MQANQQILEKLTVIFKAALQYSVILCWPSMITTTNRLTNTENSVYPTAV